MREVYNKEHIECFIDLALGVGRMPVQGEEFHYSEPDNRACPENTALVALAFTATQDKKKHNALIGILPERFTRVYKQFSPTTINNIVECVQ